MSASCIPFPTTMQTRIIMYTYDKPRSSRNKLTRLPHKPGLCNGNPNFRLRLHHEKVSAVAPTAIIQNSLGSVLWVRLHTLFVCFIRLRHFFAALKYNVAMQCLCVVLLSRVFVCWCFVAELLYLIFAGWLYQAVLLISLNTWPLACRILW